MLDIPHCKGIVSNKSRKPQVNNNDYNLISLKRNIYIASNQILISSIFIYYSMQNINIKQGLNS